MRSLKAVSVVLTVFVIGPAGAQPALSASPCDKLEANVDGPALSVLGTQVEGPSQSTQPARSPQPSRSNQPSRWWQDESFKKELGLTADQSAQIERIFQAHVVTFREAKSEHDRLEAQLSTLIAGPKTTESQVAQQADLVEASRGRMGKSRTMMLFKMRCVLTPDQRVKLDQYYQKSGRDHSSHSRNHQ